MRQGIYSRLSLLCSLLIGGGLLLACGETTTTSPATGTAASTTAPNSVPITTTPALTTQAVTTSAAVPSPSPNSVKPAQAPQVKGVTANDAKIGLYNKLELTVELQTGYDAKFNPFDPAQLDLHATLTAPSGKIYKVLGFYWQDYTSQLTSTKETLNPNGQPAWKIRFSPTEQGKWSYMVEVVTPAGKASSLAASFEVAPSANPGFLRVSPLDPSYLDFTNGTPYFAIGQNVGWYGKGGTTDYERWFKKMGNSGANFARVWMASWAMGIEWKDTPLGDYTNRLDRAWQLDRVFDLAEQDNIYILLSLLNHGAYNVKTDPEWKDNPYNMAQGGPLAQPEEFATNQEARDLFKRRLRYIVARWGYSSHLLAWEWWNEVDWTPLANPTLLKPWIQEMTAALKGWNPYPHLVTTSYGKGYDDTIYKMPEIDLVQRHQYATNDPVTTFPSAMKDLRDFGKPAIYGEFGGMGADTTSIDKYGVHLGNGEWASIMTKAFGTSMPWYWDNYVEPLNLYGLLFNGPATYLKGENLAAGHYQPVTLETSPGNVKALALKGDKKWLGWIKNNSYGYTELKGLYEDFFSRALKNNQKDAVFTPVYPPIEGVSITLQGLTPGNYKVEWWATDGKGVIKTENVVVNAASFSLKIPAFDKELAFKLIQ